MKKLMGKMFGVLLTVAILMSLIPATVISAESTGMVKSLSRFDVFLDGDIIGLCEEGTSVFIDLDPDGVGDGDFLATGGAQSLTISKGEKGYAEVVFGGNSKPIVLDTSSYDAILYTGGEGTSNEDLITFTSISLFDAVNILIEEIPEPFDVDDEDLIVAAREAYDRLGDLAAEIDEDHTNKLLAAEADLLTMKDEKAAQDVINAIEALPENITLDNEGDIANARAALENLTEDQRKLVPADTIDKLEAAEAALAALKAEQGPSEEDLAAAQNVTDLLNQLPDPEEVTLGDAEKIANARQAVNELTDEQRSLIEEGLLSLLEKDEAALKALQDEASDDDEDAALAKAVADKIAALPEPGDVTINDEYAINETLVSYNDLTPDQKALISDELMAKLNSDLIALDLLLIDYYMDIGEKLLADYGSVMSADRKTELQEAMDNANAVLNADAISRDDLENVMLDLVIALLKADEELEGIYTITDDSGAKWIQGSATGLKFRIVQAGIDDDAYEFFEDGGCYIEVDGKQVDLSNFTYVEGSVIITLKPEFLTTLSVGEHTITFKFSNSTVTTKFTVVASQASTPTNVPATGEVISTTAVAGASVIALAGVTLFLRKRYAVEKD
ncbi:MAG: hypothetical protein K6E12_05250 [Saccharofermentans sp.]|nr:hypothetical protein [Saccharofermentans sp.]